MANRIAIIRDGSDPDQWQHVSGDQNPGDDLSRGLSAEALLSSDHWIKRPAFLWEQKERWPQGPLSLGSIPDEDPEVKVDVNGNVTSVAVPFCPLVDYFRRTSSWHRLKKSIAWFLRYHENLQLASTRKKLAIASPNAPWRRINMKEMRAAELEILKCVQLHYFPEELQSLTKSGVHVAHVKKTSGLQSLDPVLVDGLIRVGGRLVWERCIRTTRKILQVLLREHTTDDEGLVTLMCEVESIMNGRPIMTVSTVPQDLEPLMPNHLLLLRSESPMPPGLFKREDQLSRRRWRQVQYLADIF